MACWHARAGALGPWGWGWAWARQARDDHLLTAEGDLRSATAEVGGESRVVKRRTRGDMKLMSSLKLGHRALGKQDSVLGYSERESFTWLTGCQLGPEHWPGHVWGGWPEIRFLFWKYSTCTWERQGHAFINRSSYLFQSAACYNKGEKSKLSILHTILVRLSKEGETREGKQYCLIHHSVVKCISNSFLLAILTWWKEPFQNTQYTRNILYIIYLRKRGFLMFSALFSLPSEQRKERN